jgi:hypothetical protein
MSGPIQHTSQAIDNWSFDDTLKVSMVEIINADGSLSSGGYKGAKKITASGTTTYIASAPAGTAQASALWQVKKISVSGNDTLIQWADGNLNFDNVATDLTTLTYS